MFGSDSTGTSLPITPRLLVELLGRLFYSERAIFLRVIPGSFDEGCNIFWNENVHLDQRYHRNIQCCRIETMSLEEFAEGKQKKTNFCQPRYVTFLVELTQILYIAYSTHKKSYLAVVTL